MPLKFIKYNVINFEENILQYSTMFFVNKENCRYLKLEIASAIKLQNDNTAGQGLINFLTRQT